MDKSDERGDSAPIPEESTPDTSKSLRFSEMRYRRLFETAQDGIILLNADTGMIEDVNPYLLTILGYTKEEMLGKEIWEIGCFRDTWLNKEAFLEVQTNHYIRYDDLPLETKAGKKVSVEFVSNLYKCDGIDIIQCNIRDETKRNLAEIALLATTRALKILSESNFALLKSKTEKVLIEEYCRIFVETGGYTFALIEYVNVDNLQNIDTMAYYGDEEVFDELEESKKKKFDENSMTHEAVSTMEIQLYIDIVKNHSQHSIKTDIALRKKYFAVILIPFKISEEIIAVLTLFEKTSVNLSMTEISLIKDVSNDLMFGIKAIRAAVHNAQYEELLRDGMKQTIQVLSETIDQRDPYTAGHQRRVANICVKIATEMGLAPERIQGISLAATIHDLGKVGIPIEILVKSSKLSDNEFSLIKDHVTIGYNIIKNVYFPWPIGEMILQHHERINGSGYPNGLRGDALLLESKILAVADVLEAMASQRPYRKALGIDAAMEEIKSNSGILYDSSVVDACVKLHESDKLHFE